MIVIPEIVIKEELDIILRNYYSNYISLEKVGSVVAPSNVDAGVVVSVKQTGAVGVSQISDVTFPIGVGLSGKYWLISTTTQNCYVWYVVDDANVSIPSIVGKRPIRVDVLSSDDAIAVAKKTANILNVQENLFSAKENGALVTIHNVEKNATRRSFLYQIFGDIKLDKMNYTESMASLLKSTFEGNSRKININLGYNHSRNNFPQVSIILPSEENDPKTIGIIQGNKDFFDGTNAEAREHAYTTTYALFITSDNYNDILLLFHFLKTVVLSSMEQFQNRGFDNVSVGGRDITVDFDINPETLYHRTVAISFIYTNDVAGISNNSIVPATSIVPLGTNIDTPD